MKIVKYLSLFVAMLMVGILGVSALAITEDYTLTDDLNEGITVDGATVVIDLNGHTITNVDDVIVVRNQADVTVRGEGNIVSTGDSGISIYSGSKVTMEDGVVINAQEFGVYTAGQATFIMNGGTINTVDNIGVGGNGRNTADYKDYTITINGGTINANISTDGYVSCGIYHPSEGTVNFNGGTINSSNGGIVQRGGVLNINGGVINTAEKTPGILGKVGDSRQVVPAAAVVVDKMSAYPAYQTIETNIYSAAVINGAAGNIEKIGEPIDINIQGGIYDEQIDESQLGEGYSAYLIVEGDFKDGYIVAKEDDFENVVSEGPVSADEVSDEDKALIEDLLKDYNLASYYDVQLLTVLKDNDGVVVDNIKEASAPVKITLGIPTDLPAVKEGFKRIYSIIRIHNGVATVIKNVTVKNNNAEFESSEFSTYVLVYNDVEETTATPLATTTNVATTTTAAKEENTSNPKTLDKIVIYVAAFGISFIGMAKIITSKKEFN